MRSTMKKISVVLILVAFLTPGFAQAQVWSWDGSAVSRDTDDGFFSMVWLLLTNMFDKNGGTLDPSGEPTPNTSTATDDETDNGGTLDPSGQPK